MRIPPLSVLLSWPTPNYVDPVTHGPALLVVNLILITLVVIALAGRFYARLIVNKWFGWDDSMIALAGLFALGLSIAVILADTNSGWNLHEWDLTAELARRAGKVAFAAKLLFGTAVAFTRLSLICFYYRLVKDSGILWFNWVLYFSAAWCAAFWISFSCETIWLCTPIQAYWVYPPVPNAHCLNEGTILLVNGVINVVLDLWTTILPIPIIIRLQMPTRQRFGVCVLLCLGFVVTVAGAIRTYFVWKSLIASWDETWFAWLLWLAAAVEVDLAVICACAPAWKSLLRGRFASLCTKLSSKLSVLRSPTSSESSPDHPSTHKSIISNPLRSLLWPQVTRSSFEEECDSTHDLEKAESEVIEPGVVETTTHDHQC